MKIELVSKNKLLQHNKIYRVTFELRRILFFIAVFCATNTAAAQGKVFKKEMAGSYSKTATFNFPQLVNRFYETSHQQLFWYARDSLSIKRRAALIAIIDSAAYLGLSKSRYHSEEIPKDDSNVLMSSDKNILLKADMLFADACISLCKDVFEGNGISSMISADEISPKYEQQDNKYILDNLLASNSDSSMLRFISSLEPKNVEYLVIKKALKEQMQKNSVDTIRALSISLNLLRWLHHFQLKEYIVVNIASATLRYYRADSINLAMKVVAGKPSTRTPRFAAYCNELVLYPYWNVPNKIGVTEFLPIAKKLPAMLDVMNIQVIDKKGSVVDMHKINWRALNKNNFPYRFRQSTGCDNALGVIKFNLTSPYDVYMHDTNLKSAFKSSYRYYSHGCIRLEKPIELGNFLMNNQLDSSFLQSCLKNQVPVAVKVLRQVPVFVIYNLLDADSSGKLNYYKDVYHLLP